MTQLIRVGSSPIVGIRAGASLVRRVRDGNTGKLLYEHPDFPTLDFTSGSLPSTATVPSAGKTQVTYARSGVAYAWAAGSPLPVLVQVAADTPRFSVCPPGVDGDWTGQAMGILFEPAGQNLLPYGRATATGWTSTNVTAGTATGIDNASNAARTLTATANAALHYRTTPPASQTAKWVFSAWVKRITGMGKVWLTLKAGVEIDISAALANFYIDGGNNHQYAWARVYVAIPGVGPWYGDINTCDRIGFRIDESGDVIAVDAMQLEIGDYPTSEILNGSATLNTRAADRLLIDTNVGGTARRYLLDGDSWAADASAAALLWRIRQERHIARVLIEPNGGNWDIDLQTPPENRPNMGWHDGAPSSVIYSISQPEGIPVRDQVYGSGYVIEAVAFGSASL